MPTSSPNFGGIWEAGVKSIKTHLTRTFVLENLTYEELTTSWAQTEAVLNSKPLCPLTTDLENVDALTPG